MTEMLMLDDGSMVPMTSVQRLKPRRKDCDGKWVRDVIGLDGEPIGNVVDWNVEELRGTIMPAIGWQIAYSSSPHVSEFHLWAEPLVAWRINGGDCTPITVEPYPEHYLIVAPDGTVRAPCGGRWDNLDEAAAAQRAEWKAERAKNEAADRARTTRSIEEVIAGYGVKPRDRREASLPPPAA